MKLLLEIDGAQNVYEGEFLAIYKGINKETKKTFIIQVPSSTSLRDDRKFQRHYELSKQLFLPGEMKKSEDVKDAPYILLDNVIGIPLKDSVTIGKISLETFFLLTKQLTNIVLQLHRQKMILKVINPDSIIVNPDSKKVKVIDFSFAEEINETCFSIMDIVNSQTIPYISPELIGRNTNVDVDFRVDIYSLGVIFYELLTGKLPITADDPFQWIHYQNAKEVVPPMAINDDIPVVLSTIVMKCLERNISKRYQSMTGLINDLEHCQIEWENYQTIENFQLAQTDISPFIEIPNKLYGREQEHTLLIEQWERVNLQKKGGAVFISGSAGVGKTRLIEEIKRRVGTSNGYFVYGKFNHYKNEIPYDTFVQSFEQLLHFILAEDEQVIQMWRGELLSRLGLNSFVMTEFIPKLQLIIGEQKVETSIPTVELESRFKLVMIDFIRIAAKLSNPLVIVFDDLHWADEASLRLIDYLLKEDVENLLLIGAYRNNHFDTIKKLTIEDILLKFDTEYKITNIALSSYTISNIQDLILDMIGGKRNEWFFLAKHLWEKTNGNAFFIQEMMKEIVERKLINYNLDLGTWEHNIEGIKALDFSENVIVFLIHKMKQMNEQSQVTIQYAACIGNTFDYFILSKLTKHKVQDLYQRLLEITQLGLVAETNQGSYTFVHDRIQQAAYSLMEDERKKITHYQIGKLMLIGFINTSYFHDKLYTIVSQLNEGKELLKNEDDRAEIAKMNLLAGKKAMGTTAFLSALTFFQHGIALLHLESWKKDYSLTYELYEGCLECAYLTNKFNLAENYFNYMIEQIETEEHRLKVLLIKLMLYTKIDKVDEVIDLGLKILNENGLEMKKNPSKLQIIIERQRLFYFLEKYGYKKIKQKPEKKNSAKALIVDIGLYMGPSLHVRNPELLAILTLKLSLYSLKNNNFENSCGIYAGYAIVEVAYFSRNKGFELGKHAIELADEVGSINDKCIVYFIFGAFVNHWKRHAKTSKHYFLKSIEYSLISGNLLYGGFALAHYIISLHIRGVSLTELKLELSQLEKYIHKIKDVHYLQMVQTYHQYIKALEGKTKDSFSFSDELFDEGKFVKELNEAGMRDRKLFDYYLCKAQIYYLLGKYKEGIHFSREAETYSHSFLGISSIPEHSFYYCLFITNGWSNFSTSEKKEYDKKLKNSIKKFEYYAKDCPENFLDKYLILKGELARIKKRNHEAYKYYQKAIEAASVHEFQQNDAIANELAGRLYLLEGMTETGRLYMTASFLKYQKMGYQTKIVKMLKEYSFLQKFSKDKFLIPDTNNITQILNTRAIIKASQAISGEIELEELLKKLMSIVLQYACANRGILVLKKDEKLVVEVEGNLVGSEIKTLLYKSYPLEDYKNVSHSIVNYTNRTQDAVLFDTETDELVFLRDTYISECKPNAILCIPIITQHKCIGMIYLENYVVNGSFPKDCIEVIHILATQFAISIENANLYKTLQTMNLNLEEKVRERTEHLQKSYIAMADTLAEKAKLEERNRIAREIHDTVGHTLTTILVQIEAGKRLATKDINLAMKNLELSQEQVRSGLNDIRKSLRMLNEGNYSNQFVPPLQSFLEEINQKAQIQIDYQIAATINLIPEHNYILYRALQEGITNGIRHGEATEFQFTLDCIDETLLFCLEDNGKGADEVVHGMGLSAMKERVEAVQGSFAIQSSVGEGFKIMIKIPIH